MKSVSITDQILNAPSAELRTLILQKIKHFCTLHHFRMNGRRSVFDVAGVCSSDFDMAPDWHISFFYESNYLDCVCG